jgi:hypothetical protein
MANVQKSMIKLLVVALIGVVGGIFLNYLADPTILTNMGINVTTAVFNITKYVGYFATAFMTVGGLAGFVAIMIGLGWAIKDTGVFAFFTNMGGGKSRSSSGYSA